LEKFQPQKSRGPGGATPAVVQPAASRALGARRSGAHVVEINPDPTPLTAHGDFALPGKAAEILPALLTCL